MEINAVSAAPERPCSQGGTAAGTPASGAFLALLMQLLGIAGEGPVTPDPGGGNPVWNPGEAGTPGTLAGVFQTVPAEKLPLSPPGDAGIMEPLLPPACNLEGPGELEEGGDREQFTGRKEVLLAALLNFCGMMENKMPATVPAGADAGGGEGNSPAAAAPWGRLLEAVVNPPAPPPEAGRGDGPAGQHRDADVVELKGPGLPELLQDETQSYDAFLKERILQLLRGSGILEPGPGSRAVDSQQPEVRQPGVLYDVSPKGNSGETDSSVNGSGPVFKDARVPVEAASGSAKPVEAREQVGSPEKRGGGETPQAGMNFSAINRHGGAGTPDHSTALHQPAGSGGSRTAATSLNPAGTVVQQETISPLQMPVLIGRVLRQTVARHTEGQTHLWFKLEPEHLGEVVVRLVYRQGDVSAHFLASNAAAGDAIESALPQLREALAAQNLHLQSASVSVGHEGGLPPRSDYQQPGYNYGRQYSGPGGEPGGSTGQEQPADPLPGGINFFV
ncbi:flagellar hook-length control protein FliK [Desulfofundulus australicus DSM 11792]|uniref:Flagellar hook-length control protein FliK n=1 Tax=Desulfofundulus australicus DSM 11792 TaxID=1121425 RepID=A0A1M4VL34_9FIRM|nr:flagellar hook-length control protein FliK [Desulfofundulus australicus]SHE69580.1 flagellar hook-length control protein FliK [Desulfofundulus australicus DSM 11792]